MDLAPGAVCLAGTLLAVTSGLNIKDLGFLAGVVPARSRTRRRISMNELSGLRVAVLATDGFEESELTEPVKALKEAGAEVVIVSLEQGQIQGMRHDSEKSIKVDVDRTIDEVSTDEFDAVHLPGGTLNADAMRMAPGVQSFLREMQGSGKPISAICHAPWELVSAGLVRGRTLTGYHTIQDDIRNAGGNWVDRDVVGDQNWVTSRQPSDLPAFNRAMIGLFSSCLLANRH
jgi:protease I